MLRQLTSFSKLPSVKPPMMQRRIWHFVATLLAVALIAPRLHAAVTTLICDFDGNGLCNITDIDMITMEIAVGGNNLVLDIDNSGAVDTGDLDLWRIVAASENGFASAYIPGDANLDGGVDTVDLNELGLNWQQAIDRYSAGDFNGSGRVDAADLNALGLNWQQQSSQAASAPSTVTTAEAHVFGERLIMELGGVQIVAIDQDPAATPGYRAARVVLRSDSGTRLVTFENLKLDGVPVQTWLSGPFGSSTPKNVAANATYPAEWIPYDSHLSITSRDPNLIGGQAGFGFIGIDETNDMSIGVIPGIPDVLGTPSTSGLGPISMVNATDAFFLLPEFQTNEVDLAYVVISEADRAAGDNVFLTIGVLGEGIINSGDVDGASFGFNGDNNDMGYAIFVPEPTTGLLASLASLVLLGIRHRRRNG